MTKSKYAQALGLLEFTIRNIDFKLTPKQGDNLEYSRLRKASAKDIDKFVADFIPFCAKLIAREENFSEGTEEYQELLTFVEFNVNEFMEEILVGFGWASREDLREAEKKAAENFQKQLGA
jgi:hypothetical protein